MLLFLEDWCYKFHHGIDGSKGCNGSRDMFFDELVDAKTFCDGQLGCLGILWHLNGKFIPRCGRMVTSSSTYWINKNGCLSGNDFL